MTHKVLFTALVFLALFLGATSQKIVEINNARYSSSLTFSAGTSFVTITNTVFSGAVYLTFNVASMMRTDMPIVIEICNCQFVSGAALLFIGGSDAQVTTAYKPMYVNINQLTMTDGGLAFADTLPYYSRIVVQKSVGMVNNRGGCSFNGLAGSGRPTTILFSNLHLLQSVLRITTTKIGGAVTNGMFPVYFWQMTVDKYSSWSMDNTNISNSFAFHGHSLAINDNSLFLISRINGQCDRFCISWEGGLSVSARSSYITEFSTASADGHDLLYVSGAMTASGSSFILFKGNYFVTPRYAFSVSSGTVPSGNSVISFVDNSLLGAPWHTSCSPSSGGNCIVQCNNLGGAALTDANQYVTAGLRGTFLVYRCDRRTNCAYSNATCFTPLTDLTATGLTPDVGCCKCKPGGIGDYCLPKVPSFIPPMCSSTLTQRLSETVTLTQSDEQSKTFTIQRDGLNTSMSAVATQTLTLSVSKAYSNSHSINQTMTLEQVTNTVPLTRSRLHLSHSVTGSFTTTKTYSESIHTETAIATDTRNLSVTTTGSVTTSMEVTGTRELTVTRETETLADSTTNNVTISTNLTTTRNLTRTGSESLSSSSCDWLRGPFEDHEGVYNYYPMQLITNPPLAIRKVENWTMQIPYKASFAGYNFTLTSLGQWALHRVDFVGESQYVRFRNLTNVKIASGMVHVGPPRETFASVLTRTVTIAITFRCANYEHTEYFMVIILPESAVVDSSVVDTVLGITMAFGMVSLSPPVAAAAAWAMVFQQVMMCRGLDENSAISFTGLSIGDDERKWLRGAIVGNLLIILGEAFLVMIFAVVVVAVARNRDPKSQFVRVLGVLQWPNVMHITVGALLQLTMTGSVSLLGTNGSVQDYVLSFVAIGFFFLYTVRICYVLYKAHKETTGGNRRWQMAQSLGAESFVFGNYKLTWFAGYETVNAFIIGIIAGFPPNQTICIFQIWAVFAASLLILCIIAYYRPMKTIFGQIFAGAIQLLTFSAANAMLVAHYVPEQQTSARNAATILLLIMPIAALLKAITDIVAFCRNGRGMWDRLFQSDKDNFEWDYSDEEHDEELGEELMPQQAVDENADLEAFLAAVDVAPEVAEKKLKKGKKPTPPTSSVQAEEPPAEDRPMNEDELFSMLKI